MKGTVHYEKRDDVALLSIDNPPVNPLSSGVRQGLFDGVTQALEDDAITSIVITGMHRAFIAGADISEFGAAASKGVGLHDVLKVMENSSKPIVAAINHTAFGGGLETALCCNYRIAAPLAPVGLPEVKLGLLPGAGGTQRLPRLAGAEAALNAMVSGDPVLAPEALELGIIDKIADSDLVEEAIVWAREIVAAGGELRRVRDIDDRIAQDRGNDEMFARAAAKIEQRQRNMNAPARILKCVEMSINTHDFDAGLAFEAEQFKECLNDPQREALIHIFFAERAANKIPGLDKDLPLVEVNKGSVVGAGLMGGGIAMCFANAGIPVRVHDNDLENLTKGIGVIEANYARTVSRGRLSQEEMDKRMSLIIPTENFEDLVDADVVIEAVYENLDLKKEIFARLDKIMPQGTLLATNTSALDVDAIAASTSRPADVCGMHFFSPANVMRLLEVVQAEKSAPLTIASALALGKRIGKVSVVAGNCPGFIGNRMIHGYSHQASQMILEGAKPAHVDKVMYDFGLAMGPFTMLDMVGLDLGWRARKMVGGSNDVIVRVPDELCELGRYGQKTGKGFYRYEEGDRAPLPDPEADEVIKKVVEELGYPQKEFTDEEILKRCIYPLVNIGANILDEGHALRAGDIDTVYCNGYGFPTQVGGPMWYADSVGLDNVLADIERFFADSGDELWRPSELLVRLVKEGKTFASLDT